ncbi:acetyl-CoA C-acyltransferase [Bacillus sp. LLTC93]|uniref:acetyl-CoA C-acyltransferase n=1 Tax=Bacillus sp. LLTC93 TaxID=2108274 RepID=UPI000D01C910|nr:acetyl-CoA C-acyltransferase [Bacillus sp. LLTC93]PRO42956.1 acetyl-CoA C-acyltransferase [Bacillus sp. LLTC93]
MQAVIVEAKRTPFGDKNGMLKDYRPEHLAAPLIQHLSQLRKPDDVILGNVVGGGGNIARLSSLEAGMSLHIPGMTIDRQCASGLEAIRTACVMVQSGEGSMYIAGGTESISGSPMKERARFSPEWLGDPHMGEAAELAASRFSVTRREQDDYALLSWERSIEAFKQGTYLEEIVPIDGLNTDEAAAKIRPIARLIKRAKPVFLPEGTVTVTNSCKEADGAAAVVVMEKAEAEAEGLRPKLRYVGSAVTAMHPHFPAASPIDAIKKLLHKEQMKIEDVALFEINEAFALKVALIARTLGIPYDRINRRGGALCFGHPYSASGASMMVRLFYEAHALPKGSYVMAAIGSGGGVGLAVLCEVLS